MNTPIIQKRVCCLYRVSTVGQVEKDDILMQKQACREFSERQDGWKIVKEFLEKVFLGLRYQPKSGMPCKRFSAWR